MNRSAIVLLSGGLDSATALYWARSKGYRCHCLIFDYGQRHKREIRSAKALARKAGASFDVIRLSLPWLKKSSLVNSRKALPDIPLSKIGSGPIPSTYVPGRNTLFVAHAISAADALGFEAIIIAANAYDFSGYPDCRPHYYRAFNQTARLGTKRGSEGKPIKILTPFIRMTKKQIVRLGAKLGVPWQLTWSCYAGGRRPCGRCDSCKLRAKGFVQCGLIDPCERRKT